MFQHKSDQAKIKPQKDADNKRYTNSKQRERRPPKKISESYLHNSGLYYLERFAASKKHFIFVMSRKVKRSCMHHTDQDYDACIVMVHALADKFERTSLLDDTVYTNGLVASLRRKGKSRSAIVNKMRMKGIAPDQTIEALEKLDHELHDNMENAEMNAALRLAKKKKLGPYFIGEEQNMKKSLGVFARAGFSYQVAKSILDMDDEDINDGMF
ncbi:MAG: RecX family transcriptional regulator [Alphaproteobacteria bacterium]|nr:MAG: RecX family transcriptional regulator [Alphaproteobacteria bacterium]